MNKSPEREGTAHKSPGAAARDMRRLTLLLSCLPRHPAALVQSPRLLEPRRRRVLANPCARLSMAAGDGTGPFGTVFELPMKDGLCLALQLPEMSDQEPTLPISELHPLERDRLAHMKPARKISFTGGRVALRRALENFCSRETVACPVLPDELGAPTLPEGAMGSISHTHGLVAAAVSVPPDLLESLGSTSTSAGGDHSPLPLRAIGVDIEAVDRFLSPRAAIRCLHEVERRTLADPPTGLDSSVELLLRVSIKEALYKALHPLVRRTIRWHSVQVAPAKDGSCEVDFAELEKQVGARLAVSASWSVRDGYFVTLANASILGAAGGNGSEAAPTAV